MAPKAPKSPPKRRQRAHDVLPAGLWWREGRPRWNPSPTRRKQGWSSIDLKDAKGKFLELGPAVARAEAINAVVKAWLAGEPVPEAFAAIAPAGAQKAGTTAADLKPRSIGALLEAYYGHIKFTTKAAKTQSDYRSKHKRFLQALAVSPDSADPGADLAAVTDAKVEAIKRADIDCLLPPEAGEEGEFELERVYDLLREHVGEHMAFGVMGAVSAWLGFLVKKKRTWASNPAELVERSAPDGRIRVALWPELVALVTEADGMGLHSIADAIILGVDLSWNQQDILALRKSQVAATFHVKHRRIKTGQAGNPRLLAVGRQRMQQILDRHAAAQKAAPVLDLKKRDLLLICEMTGEAWVADTFRHKFADVRDAAAARAARRAIEANDPEERARAQALAESLPTLRFQDLRDTTITYCIDAGLTLEQTCARSLHSPVRAQAVITKHYGAIGQGVADAGADKLDAHFAAMGYTFEKER